MNASAATIAFSLASVFSLSSISAAVAQDKPQNGAAPAAWTLACRSADAATAPLDCQIEQRFFRQQTGELVTVLAVSKSSAKPELFMTMVLPHGLKLQSGVAYQVDKGELSTAAISSSTANGAIASIPLSSDFLSVLKAGTTLTLNLETDKGAKISIPVPLAGFTAAVNRLVSIK